MEVDYKKWGMVGIGVGIVSYVLAWVYSWIFGEAAAGLRPDGASGGEIYAAGAGGVFARSAGDSALRPDAFLQAERR